MADAVSTHKADPILVAEIVRRSYVAENSIAVDQIGALIATSASHAERPRRQ